MYIGQTIDDICKCRFPNEYHRRAVATLELVMVKRGVLDVQIWMSVQQLRHIDAVLDFFLYLSSFS